MDYNNFNNNQGFENLNRPPYQRKINIFGIITSILLAVTAFLPFAELNSAVCRASEIREAEKILGSSKFSFFKFASLFRDTSILGRSSEFETVASVFVFFAVVVLFNALLGLIFSICKLKAPNIVFTCLNMVWVIFLVGFMLACCSASDDVMKLSYGAYIMVVVSVVHLVQSCIYRTKAPIA